MGLLTKLCKVVDREAEELQWLYIEVTVLDLGKYGDKKCN